MAKVQTSAAQRSIMDPDLEWLLVASSVAMRERGTMAGVLSSLELGGFAGGIPNTDLYNDAQVGWRHHTIGDVERHRWLTAAWRKLDERHQGILLCCYSAPMAAFRADQGFGARDHCPDVEAINRGAPEPHGGKHAPTRTGVDSRLGRLAMLAFALTDNPAGLLQACRDPGYKGGSKLVQKALRAAEEAAKEAHAAWLVAKTGRPRKDRERVSARPTREVA